jgi:hypothetical protein
MIELPDVFLVDFLVNELLREAGRVGCDVGRTESLASNCDHKGRITGNN